MPKEKLDFSALQAYIPEGSLDAVLVYIYEHKVQLTITRKRASVLGDYRHAHASKGHRISINGDLNEYAFLITLLHELAHLLTFEKYNNKVLPHGQEWKATFSFMLIEFLKLNIFPTDIQIALKASITNPAASSCADVNLLRVLKNYDKKTAQAVLVEQLQTGEKFAIKGNRIFEKGHTQRKRIKCREIATGKLYLFSPVHEVIKII